MEVKEGLAGQVGEGYADSDGGLVAVMDPSSHYSSAPMYSSRAGAFLPLDFSTEFHKAKGALERICGATNIEGHGLDRRLSDPAS